MNEPVYNMQREKIGKIEDYMLDLDRGCVEYAVLSFGGFLGIGEKLFAIPWQSMTLDTENRAWLVDVSEERLKQAPGFDKDNWPDMGEASYRESISSFWAVNTGTDRGAYESSGSASTRYAGQGDTTRDRDADF
ncbi:MAG: photosystem reaction center subunit H [Actinobacteria bacterium HGW-Actinobacteria-10]|nr:MAG: photosystem reaction center subunit H [Actinobacteria bacterium HGW-Actinobacteria-10]